ncbi:MAG: hypothetical protein A3B96_03735 [Candidatus Spechtbacteria bacterium RIFCSPHIGHO2_02_FULL_43_15b]|uniref:Thymidylate synthase n=1 Tax=Candidatus Spechtbacteria bacterium RIFCSPHIGHO2_01_FULL_43_30 TaxID=1802158 RepID=A0A1G2H828_9BACT|nr:MAG: hypothetical protein A2827_03255 [Candidatus Spechtbacteria bacterium RIFCSPHIGHO2_01_FULL_43_30]OGZ59121.1 MAG: hypothetical protein A3B96_03735 [Candidatus Spechtbacteria bacterium RIFCSPHIGHO2_02_FULL_43_15b]
MDFSPKFKAENWSEKDRYYLKPFVSDIDGLVYSFWSPLPELIGALCSRASRAGGDLRRVFLSEYIYPILEGKDNVSRELKTVINFLHKHSFHEVLRNKRAQEFYIKWYAQYGDDSISQVTGAHLMFWGLSQPALKFVEDQRIGLAPIEKSTRYVDYSSKVNGRYLYYTDPTLGKMGLSREYREVLDGLFDLYSSLAPVFTERFKDLYPNDGKVVWRTKAFDTLRGLLPSATLSQVAFMGNGQAFEYMIARAAEHPMGELRWVAKVAKNALNRELYSILLRLESDQSKSYQKWLGTRRDSVQPILFANSKIYVESENKPSVKLIDYDKDGENKIVAALLFERPREHRGWNTILSLVEKMSDRKKVKILSEHFAGRTERWQKIGRAFENAFIRFEITMNLGAYRDLHRHRMHTQERQFFSVYHGYDVPKEIEQAGKADEFKKAMNSVEKLFRKIESHDPYVAQYVPTLAHRIRFYQYQNVRQFFWEGELRTISQGHPDYRKIEQEKFRLAAKVYPLIARFAKFDMNDYEVARRGAEESIKKKEEFLRGALKK